MNTIIKVLGLVMILAGCVADPVPVGVNYVEPTYAMPGPGYAWQYHPEHGWGWHHPNYGWHQGWR
jgi:hypothetical protein